MRSVGLLLALLFGSTLQAQQPITRADLKPGLVFTASDGPGKSFVNHQVSQTVGLTLQPNESVHPQSENGGTAFTWTGTLNVLQPSKYQFSANLHGKLEVRVGGELVLTGESDGKLVEGKPVELKNGFQIFEVKLTRTAPTVRLELLWNGPGYRTEPIPYFFFGHLPKQRPAEFMSNVSREHGRFLFEENSCIKCHQAEKSAEGEALAKSLTDRTGPNLTDIAKRAYPGWLDAWLADPQKHRPNSVMPKMFTEDERGQAERYAVVVYLSSLGGTVPEGKNPPVQQYSKSVNDGRKLYITAGCAACHGDKLTQPPTKKKKDDDEDEKPEAAPEDLAYSFGNVASKGFYLLGHVGSKTSPEALSKYLQNPLATNPHGRMPNMMLNSTEAMDLARFMCQQKDEKISKAMPSAPKLKPTELVDDPALNALKDEPAWREVGRRLMTSKGCVNCHTVESGKKLEELKTAPLLKQLAGSSKACLSGEKTTGKSPSFNLTERDRQSLRVFLKDGLSGAGKPAPAHKSRVALRRFQCLNCHNRDGEGGFSPELTDEMRANEKAENAEELNPPRLTSVGHKLRTSWFKQILTQAGRARPWMTLRMPQYGPHNVEFIAEALPKAEGTLPSDEAGKVTLTASKVEAGRTLAGKNGLGCISCHDISGVRGGGTRGPDLAKTQDRVRLDWYFRWMHQPQRLAPGTKMPQAFIDGKSLLTTVLNGDGDGQIEAMWAYFSLGQGLPLPAGMEPPKGLVIAVKDRPEILRTFMPDNAGTKAIAIGFPGGVNTVFDAATCRLSYGWSGAFLDASPVWNNRGGAPAILLGPKFWTAPGGFPWAITENRTPPDFSKRLTDPAYGFQLPEDRLYNGPRLVHFQGYSLDSAGVPSFTYNLSDTEQNKLLGVVEKPEPLPVTVAAGLKRSFQVEVPANKVAWFQVGKASTPRASKTTGEELLLNLKDEAPEVAANGTRVILPDGGKATVAELLNAPQGAMWRFVKIDGGWSLLLRLPEANTVTKSELVLAVWGLPRDDEELLKGLKAK